MAQVWDYEALVAHHLALMAASYYPLMMAVTLVAYHLHLYYIDALFHPYPYLHHRSTVVGINQSIICNAPQRCY
jgi:hypothetical protein